MTQDPPDPQTSAAQHQDPPASDTDERAVEDRALVRKALPQCGALLRGGTDDVEYWYVPALNDVVAVPQIGAPGFARLLRSAQLLVAVAVGAVDHDELCPNVACSCLPAGQSAGTHLPGCGIDCRCVLIERVVVRELARVVEGFPFKREVHGLEIFDDQEPSLIVRADLSAREHASLAGLVADPDSVVLLAIGAVPRTRSVKGVVR